MKIKIKKPNQIGIKIHGKKVYPELENLVVIPSGEEQKFKSEAYGYNEVTVKAVQSEELVIEPTKEVQTKEGLFNKVTVNPIESEELNITPQKTPQEFNGLFNKVNVEAVEINLQDKIIQPTKSIQEVMADDNFDGMKKVTIAAIPDEFIVPTDNIAIIENGTYNVTDYETATVNVPTPEPNLGTKEVTANGEYSASEDNLDGYSKVSVNIPIPEPNVATKTITANGTYNSSDEGLDGYSSVEVNVASSGGGSDLKITNASYLFNDSARLEILDELIPMLDGVTNTSYMFQMANNLTTLDLTKLDMSNVTNMSYMFYLCRNLTDLDLSNIDVSKANIISYMFYSCTNLTNLKFFKNLGKGYTRTMNNTGDYKLDLSTSTKLTHDSLMSVINNLYDLNITYGGTLYRQQLVLGSTNKAKLTDDEIAIATNKGWTVT